MRKLGRTVQGIIFILTLYIYSLR